jgi:hypothetical protein
VPRDPDAGSSRIDRVYSIRFQHFSDLCKALAVTCDRDVKDSLVKAKMGKREKRRSVIVYLAAFFMEKRRRACGSSATCRSRVSY